LSGAAAGIDGGPARGRAASERVDPLAGTVFALLVIACFAAFFVTQRLKHTPTAIQRFERTPSFTPSAAPPRNLEEISFKLAEADEATVAIIDSDDDVVATLVRDRPLERYKQFSLRWNGRRGTAHRYGVVRTPSGRAVSVAENEGPLAPPGEYRVRVSLRREDRTVLSPWSFTLVGR
jgi:hypothetical protein